MSKYVPKIGEECEVLNSALSNPSYEKCKPIFVGLSSIVYESESCSERMAHLNYCEFRPIPTKADVERERLLEILNECYESSVSIMAKEIQKAGFTIPKKVKRSDVLQIIYSTPSNLMHDDIENLGDKICELLGDLVESDV
tara:strand:- start:5973 stop:6395 length:423 start_codon:yes stop_codon:yes gene_type:complete